MYAELSFRGYSSVNDGIVVNNDSCSVFYLHIVHSMCFVDREIREEAYCDDASFLLDKDVEDLERGMKLLLVH